MEPRIGNAAYRVGQKVTLAQPDDCNDDFIAGEQATITEVFAFREGYVIPVAQWEPQPGDNWGYALATPDGRTGNFYGDEIARGCN